MAVVQLTGFETQGNEESSTVAGTTSIQNSVARNGGYALRTQSTGAANSSWKIGTNLATTGANAINVGVTTSYFRFYFQYATGAASGNEEIFKIFDAGGSTNVLLALNSDGTLTLTRSGLTANGTTPLAANTWYCLELLIGGGVGAPYELKIDQVSEFSGTASFGVSSAAVNFGKTANRNSQDTDYFFDDFVWRDDQFPGPGQIVILSPDADGTYQTWEPDDAGAGPHWSEVSELPVDSDSSFLRSKNVDNDAETEALQGAADKSISGTINGVKYGVYVRRNGASSGAVRLRFRSGTTNVDHGINFVSIASYNLIAGHASLDPDTGSAWTTSGIDSLEVGLIEKATTSTTRSRFTSCWAQVDFLPADGSGVGSATGDATVTATGSATNAQAGSASGSATVLGESASTGSSVASAAGEATVLGESSSTFLSVGTTTGDATVLAVGNATASSVASTTGDATVLATSLSLFLAVGATTGDATVLGISAATVTSVDSATGDATVTAIGNATASSVASATGTAVVVGIGFSINPSDFPGGSVIVIITERILTTGVDEIITVQDVPAPIALSVARLTTTINRIALATVLSSRLTLTHEVHEVQGV